MKICLLSVVALLAIFRTIDSVAYGGACDTDSECSSTTANTYCEPAISASCQKGKCECQPHLDWDSTASACKLRRYYLNQCTSDQSCQKGTSCIAGQCKCASGSYNILHECVSTSLKNIGEICDLVSECHADAALSGSVVCTILPGSRYQVKRCYCADGYIQQNNMCRKPHHGELCLANVGCASRKPNFVASDATFTAETCVDDRCACPDTHRAKTIRVEYENVDFCIATSSGTQVGYAATCASMSSCAVGVCYQCPGATDKTCVLDPL